MLTLEGKTAIITGAARGQGEAEARLFARLGGRVVLADVLDEPGKRVADEIGEAARYVHLDVTEEAGWEAVVDTAVSAFGGVDVLINNAGVFRSMPLADESVENFERTLRINLVGPFLGIKAVREAMVAAGGGSIVNISSVGGLTGIPRTGGYGASKWGLRGLTKIAALELGQYGIRVNSVHPGVIDTPMVAEVAAMPESGAHPGVALGRVGLPNDVAGLVAFLASDASAYLTGAEIAVDGGSSAGPMPPAAAQGSQGETAGQGETAAVG
ncbi:glucose 1-dehydrogenase [Streptomyces purpurogeneiscleroticus]|uniref:glucose 1-dehydrogenase n=1 Tax=Streptomyces purpurogeneiscleroticus TaxID=68259 RepID=UPI001CBD316A|nr:glucose 1-dehydrogenase [Streptomyces purpurogeneiscleroticus]